LKSINSETFLFAEGTTLFMNPTDLFERYFLQQEEILKSAANPRIREELYLSMMQESEISEHLDDRF
jgi:hypothetical protein